MKRIEIEKLINNTTPALKKFARRLAREKADDLLQDTLLRLLLKSDKFEGDSKDFIKWSFCIMVHLYINYLRYIKRRQFLDSGLDIIESNNNVEETIFCKDICKIAEKILSHEKYKILISIVKGKTYSEIADELNLAIGTVKSRLARTRDELRMNLE